MNAYLIAQVKKGRVTMKINKKINKKNVAKWAQEHKKELIITGVGVGVTAASVVLIKRNPAIIRKPMNSAKGIAKKTVGIITTKSISSQAKPSKPQILINGNKLDEALKMRTGNMFSAANLGKKVNNLSAQKINQRLIDAGLAKRTPNGSLYPTEIGKMFYRTVSKDMPWGYSSSVHQWDECVLKLIFSKEELMNIAERMATIEKICRKVA